jgi:predicted amidohydrolase YtcJ
VRDASRTGYASAVLGRLLILAFALANVSASGQILPRPPAPDLVLFNGKIITVDRGFTIHASVAIIGDRIMAVGNDDQMKTVAGPATRMIDLKGHAVIPGLMDNHLHGAGGGPGVDLSRTRSLADVTTALQARVAASQPGDLIVSNSDWHEAQLKEQRLPLRDDLDRIAPQNPVVLVRGGHEYIVNSAALTRWGITPETPQPKGGRITRYPDGRLNGELVDTAKALVQLPRVVRTSGEAIVARIADYQRLHAAGLTTVRHPGVSLDEYNMVREIQRRGQLTMRVNVLMSTAINVDATAIPLLKYPVEPGEGDDWLRVGGVKLAVDGGFEGGLMREPYEEPWGENKTFRGLQTVDTERFIAAVRILNERGWRVATHAVGDAAIDLVLNAYEKANAERSIVRSRWTIEHAFIGRPDHLPRMKALGLAISAQNHLYLAGPSLVKYWGATRAGITTPVKMYLDAGLPVSSGTDAPVVPYPPLWTLYHFVTRDTITGGVLGADQKVTRQQALRMATINNAWLNMEERTKGSIEPGKFADLVILNEDPLTCPDTQLRDAKVLMTMVGGKVVAGDLRMP